MATIGAAAVVVSLSYMTFVSLTPASQRPYIDGSTHNSVYQQVFDYNGFSRVGQASPNQVLGRTLGTPLFSQAEPPPAWNRLLTRSYGRDTGWLLPAAVVAAAAILVARRRRPRTDLPRAGVLLWGTWLLALAVVFSVSTTMNSYYAGALSPAVAGLLGIGSALAWEHRGEAYVAVVTAGTVLITVGYAAWLLPTAGTGLPSGLAAAAIALEPGGGAGARGGPPSEVASERGPPRRGRSRSSWRVPRSCWFPPRPAPRWLRKGSVRSTHRSSRST